MRVHADNALALWICSWVALAAVLPRTASSNEPEPVAQLKAGEWYEVPDSHLKDVAAPMDKFRWLAGGIYGITACWSGGAFDSQRDRLYLGPGGGHGGYNGNEIYAFDLKDLKWHRLNDPDPVIPGTEHTDLNVAPFAMHTYDAVEYVPPPFDRYVVVGGWATPPTYAMDPDRPDRWEIYPGHGTGRTGDICAYDAASGLLWLSTPITAGKLSQWDPLTHHWTLRRKDSPDTSYYETADVDWKRHLMLSCGGGKLKAWSLLPVPAGVPFEELKTTGDTEVMDHPSPGFCYAPFLDRFVAWAAGPDVYTLDLDAKRWTKHSPAASNKVLPGPPDERGTFGRFRYVPSKNVFILYNDVQQNVFIYRLTADQPNVITGVEAKLSGATVETDLPAAAVTVQAIYADGTRRDVTGDASYFSLDPTVAAVDVHGRGVIRGLAPGTARIRAVYSDPAFKRGYGQEVVVPVRATGGNPTLKRLEVSAPQLTMVAGDTFRLKLLGSFVRGNDAFERVCTAEAQWSSSAPEVASVDGGVVRALREGGSVSIQAAFEGQTVATEVTVRNEPVIQRIAFQVKPTPPRAGWNVDNGERYSDARGFGWLNIDGLATRDDRDRARTHLLKSFVRAEEKQFQVQVPSGTYVVRLAMGDADYGAVPFEDYVALGTEKLLYYEGRNNDVATQIVRASDKGLIFTVNGPINYLIVAPVGVDLDKYADDGPAVGEK